MKFLVCKVNTQKDLEKIGKIADQFGINPRGIVGFFDDRFEWCGAMSDFGTLVNTTMTRKIIRTTCGLVKLDKCKNYFSFGRFHFNCEAHDEYEIEAYNYNNDLHCGTGAAWRFVDALNEESEEEPLPIVETPIRFLDSLLITKPTTLAAIDYSYYGADDYLSILEPLSTDNTQTLIPNRLVVTDDLCYVVIDDPMLGFSIIPFFQNEPIFIRDNIKISPMRNQMSESCYAINYHITLITDDAIKAVHYVVYLDDNNNISRVLFDCVTDFPIDANFPFSEEYRDITAPNKEKLFYESRVKAIMGFV